MKIIVHHPKSPENISILEKRVADIHAEAVLRYIDKLVCPKEQRINLLNALIEKGSQ